MAKKKARRSSKKSVKNKIMCRGDQGCGGCAYFLGFIGAAIYYISSTEGFWMGVLGVLKAIIWPLFLVWKLMQFIGA